MADDRQVEAAARALRERDIDVIVASDSENEPWAWEDYVDMARTALQAAEQARPGEHDSWINCNDAGYQAMCETCGWKGTAYGLEEKHKARAERAEHDESVEARPQLPALQRQDSLLSQIDDLLKLAVEHGMYDAHDWLRRAVLASQEEAKAQAPKPHEHGR